VHSGVKLGTNCWATFTTELEPWSPEPSLAPAARPPNDFVHFGGQTPPDTTSGCLSLDLSKISYRTLKVNDERTRDKSGTQHKNGTIGCPGRHRYFPGTDPRNRDCPGKTGTDGHLTSSLTVDLRLLRHVSNI
jgi:hypothetical protein